MANIQDIGAFVSGLNYGQLPGAVVEKVKVILLHNLTMALAGADGGELGAAYIRAAKLRDAGGATVFLTGERVPVQEAALANGILFHARAQDDVQQCAGTHIGAIALPAALAVAEWIGAPGQALLPALVAAYEVTSVIAADCVQITNPRGFRASGIFGPFAAAAAAASLLKLDAAAAAHALSLAAHFAGGLNQVWLDGTGEYRVQTAAASRSGILAALLARAGADSAPAILEGSAGFYRAFAGEARDIGGPVSSLGTRWQIMDVSFKPYPVCAINQVPVRTVLEMMAAHPFRLADVAAVRLTLCPYDAHYAGIDATGPFRDVAATLMSAQFSLAAAIQNGQTVTRAQMAQVAEAAIMDLVPRISIAAQADLPRYGCVIEAELRSGEVLRGENRRGADTFRYGWPEALQVARALQPEMYVSAGQFANLLELIAGVERLADTGVLVAQCVRAQ